MPPTPETRPALVAFALFVTAIVFACATISNDNLQDLKTGQLVGASPMRQQIALIVGVAAGAAVIPSVLNLLAKAYGFAGAPNVGVVAPNPLPAPQATLISALAQGVIGGNLEWKMIGIGALVGVGLILLDDDARRDEEAAHSAARRRHRHLSADVGDVRGGRRRRDRPLVQPARARRCEPGARRSGSATLVASGLIVGESLWGVLNAGLIVAHLERRADRARARRLRAREPSRRARRSSALIVWLYRWMLGEGSGLSPPAERTGAFFEIGVACSCALPLAACRKAA